MPFIHFYSGKSLAHVADLSSDLVTLSYTVGLSGSLKGEAVIEETDSNATFLKSLKENSHFLRLGYQKVQGGVVESAHEEHGIWTVGFCGFLEWTDKVDAIASHKAGADSLAMNQKDKSAVKFFYADSPLGVFYEVLMNNAATMEARGYDSSLIQFSNLYPYITSTADTAWARSYRLNSAEVPTLKAIIDDIFSDDGMQLITVNTSSTLTDPFSWTIALVLEAPAVTVDEATASVFEVQKDPGDAHRRAFSVAKGTNLKDEEVVERMTFDSEVAYSSLVTSSAQERSASIGRTAATAAKSAAAVQGQLTFSSFQEDYELLFYLTVGSSAMPSQRGLVTEVKIEGEKVTYTLQLGEASAFQAEVRKPVDAMRRIIFNPLRGAGTLATQVAGRRTNSTGWRS